MLSIKFRPAIIDDAKNVLRWKNDPVTRKFAIATHDKIEWENHLKYFKKHMQDIRIIEVNGEAAGDIRMDDEEVSIRLDKKFRGQGIGYAALKEIIEPNMIAKIVDGNIASFRLFIKLGFKPVFYKKGYYILER